MDREEFAKEFIGLCEVYGKEPSAALVNIYYSILKELTIEQFQDAIGLILSNRKYTKLPLPVEFISFVHGDPEEKALVALEKVERAVKEVGAYVSIIFDDPVIHRVINSVPEGWIGVCGMTFDEWVWFRKDFVKLYQAFSKNHDMPTPVKLYGRHDLHNEGGGYQEKEYLTLFSDRKKIENWIGEFRQIEPAKNLVLYFEYSPIHQVLHKVEKNSADVFTFLSQFGFDDFYFYDKSGVFFAHFNKTHIDLIDQITRYCFQKITHYNILVFHWKNKKFKEIYETEEKKYIEEVIFTNWGEEWLQRLK